MFFRRKNESDMLEVPAAPNELFAALRERSCTELGET
jgi:hypothetical protein